MFHHVALLRFHEEVTEAQIAALDDALATLPGRIDTLVGYRFGADVGLTEGAWDYAVVADFTDRSGYEVYRDHSAHHAVLTDHSGPMTAQVARVQFAT
jgi:hypothetical protein